MALLFFALIAFFADVIASEDSCTTSRALPNPSYSYSNNAPSLWSQLKPEYSLCGSGLRQSPIDVQSTNFTSASPPIIESRLSVMRYGPDTFNLHWTCTGQFGSCGRLIHGDTSANLVQVHPHSPSENRINGVRYPLELHFVHATADGALSVVAVLFRTGRYNEQLQHLLDAAKRRHFAVVDLPVLSGVETSDLCSFDGSLTTPPCKEGVRWYVSLAVKEASLAQIGEYRKYCGESPNARPKQRMNGRNVVCYTKRRKRVEW